MTHPALLALALLAAAGCGAKGRLATIDIPPGQPPAYLTVIRPSILGLAFRFHIFLDGQRVLGLGVREHATIRIPPGTREVSLQRGYRFNTVTIDAEPGQHYYVVIQPNVIDSDPVLVPAAFGRELVEDTTRLEID